MNVRRLLQFLPASTRGVLLAHARRWRASAVHATRSYTPADLRVAIERLGISDGDTVMMHSAFSALNGFLGEPSHVIDCILDVIGPKGHLLMVSMPYGGSARDYLAQHEVFNVRRTPSQMGVISESFRRRRGVLRSANPLHPMLAYGPRAAWIIDGHEALSHSCGAGSPYHKLLALDAKALFFDVGVEVLTFAHFLEDYFRDEGPVQIYADEPMSATMIDVRGEKHELSLYPFSNDALRTRNFTVLYDELHVRHKVHHVKVGNTRMQSTSIRDVFDTARELVERGTYMHDASQLEPRIRPTAPGGIEAIVSRVHDERRTKRGLRMIRRLVRQALEPLEARRAFMRLPSLARTQITRDHAGLPASDPGAERALEYVLQWICNAQDCSASADGGVAHDFSLINGWSRSYPETTGYIVPTMIEHARRSGDERYLARARRMLDWLVSIQLPEGGFQGGAIGDEPVCPVTFNTGQILIGLAAGAARFGDDAYVVAMHRAAQWLVDTQDADGCWRNHPSPHAERGERVYDTHVAWGLFEAARVAPDAGYQEAAIRNVEWALTHQRRNGWFGRNCIDDSTQPLTHVIGYALRGVIEAYRFTKDPYFLESARLTADALVSVIGSDGYLPGRFRSDWTPSVSWSCLTGTSQIAHSLLILHDIVPNETYLQAAQRSLAYVRRTISTAGAIGVVGGVQGSFPVDGGYCTMEFPNWAAKFTIDATWAELDAAHAGRARSVA